MKRVTAMLAAAWIVLLPAGMAGAAEGDPVALVKEVMRLELWTIATGRPPDADSPFGDAALDRFYTPELKAAYLAVMERSRLLNEPLLDGDPITGRQEYCPLRDLEVEMADGIDNRVGVTVAFRSQWCFPEAGPAVADELTVLAFVLVRGVDGWRIDDFVDERQGSFRDLLADLMKQ